MLYLLPIEHSFLQDLRLISSDDRVKKIKEDLVNEYRTILKKIIKEHSIITVFEEWIDPVSDCLRYHSLIYWFFKDEANIKIDYYEVDPPEKDRPLRYNQWQKNIENCEIYHNFKENAWVNLIKQQYLPSTNALLIVGNAHLENKFSLEDSKVVSLKEPLIDKLKNNNIESQKIILGKYNKKLADFMLNSEGYVIRQI